jgi:hypothetical protein
MRSAAARARAALLKYRTELEQVRAHLEEAHAHLEQARAAHLAEIDQALGELEADIAGMPKIPIRNLILAAVQRAPRRGRTRAQIIEFIEQHFGIKVNKSTATVTLNRLQNQGLVEFADGVWLPL